MTMMDASTSPVFLFIIIGGVVALAAVVGVVFWLFGGRDKDE
jgi:hypothetical protein